MLFKFVFLLSLSVLSLNSVQSQHICELNMTFHQHLRRTGFHRNLTYVLVFENPALHKNNSIYYYDGCIVSLHQSLPSGVYVDPDELENFRRSEGLLAHPHDAINIEVAAPYAHPVSAYVYSKVKFDKIQTFLPVHARYQSPRKGGGEFVNVINRPDVYLRCPDGRIDDCAFPIANKTSFLCDNHAIKTRTCVWKQVFLSPADDLVTWEIPVGNLDHFYLVESGTMLIMVLGSLYILKTIHDYQTVYIHRIS